MRGSTMAWIACALCLSVLSTAAPAAEWRQVTEYPAVPPAKLEPLPGIGPAALSTLTGEQVRGALRYGRLHMLRGIEKDAAADDAVYKDLGVAIVSHSGFHRGALPWNNRPKTIEDMVQVSKDSRAHIANTHKLGALVLAYADYQRWFTNTHHVEWPQQRVIWKHLLGETPEDDADFVMRLADGKIATARGGLYAMGAEKADRVILCLNAPTTLARAKGGIAIDVANGCDGSYFDCGGFRDVTCYCDHCKAAWREWLGKMFTDAQRRDVFGEADPAKIPLPALSRGPGGGEAWGRRPNVPPAVVAFVRFRIDATAWFRAEIKAYGRSLNPNYIMTSTCWAHDGRPTFWNAQFEKFVGERGDDFLFWEPGAGGPGGVADEEAAKAAAGAAPDYRWGRRSFSPTMKYLRAMARGCPAVSKMSPRKGKPEEAALNTELLYAETYASLCSMRSGYGGGYDPGAVKAMHRFQDENAACFVGSEDYAPVAVLVSFSQGIIDRKDASFPFIRLMEDLGVDCRAIVEGDLTPEGLARFECVVLPAVDMLSESQMAALESYARKGGRLVAFGPCGTRDEWDRDRPNGLERLVGDLAKGAGGKETLLSADGRIAFVPVGVCGNMPDNIWYRRARDWNEAEVRKAFEGTLGKAWPYLAEPSPARLIHLAKVKADGGARIAAHVVNYDLSKPLAPFGLDVRLYGGLKPRAALFIAPEKLTERLTLPVQEVQVDGKSYARVKAPGVRVYGVVAIDCAE